ncbi:FG-GAP-like repeat-containing protein [Tunturibacter psychrotolerans]|uniref:FG-GAP-like repeat-containing protein n=1 Tax=Tunturiibacter psychrotolerans TaxID=3069686 RepID=A0AAU7ZUR2_9BACT
MRFSALLCFPALAISFFLISLCTIAAAQSPVTISLALSSPTQPAATPTTATVTAADSAGPIRFGMVDILDGTQKVQTLQLVSTSRSGFTPGTAILRHIFAPGSHQLTAAFHATTADAAANSSPVTLTVTPGTYTSTSALRYAQTIDFSVNDSYNVLTDVVVADFNNDGIPDIATVQGYPNALAVSLADKPGHFLPPTNLPIASNNDNSFIHVFAADLDADGLVDLIVTGGADDYTVFFRNNPAAPGTFLAPTELIPGKGTPIVIADFNHDGLPDIAYIQGNALSTNPNNITVALNQQTAPGTFPSSVTSSSFSGYDVVGLNAADMNGDGFPDLVVRCAPSYNGNLPASADTWEFIVFLADPAHPGQFLAPAFSSPPAAINSIALQDLNHDGLPDVVVSGTGSFFSVYLGDPAHPGQLLAPQNTTAPGNLAYLYTIAVGDIDGDGTPDVIATDGENTFLIFPGKGDGTFLAPTSLLEGLTAPAWDNSATVLADLDGDGLNDLITTEYAQNTAQIFLHNTQAIAPTLQTATDLPVSPSYVNIASGTPITFTVTETASSGQPTGSVDLIDFVGFPPYTVIATLPLVGNTATFTTSSLTAGVHGPVAVFHGNSLYAPSQSAGPVLNILPSQSTTIQLTATPNPATFGQAVTLRATLTGSYGTPVGSVTFIDSGQNLAGVTLVNGVASFTTSILAVGSHTIQVGYPGNYEGQSETSAPITVTITGAPDFSLSLSSTTATITHGSAATTTISLTPLNSFSAATSLTCTGAPANSTCSISSPSVTPAGAAATATLTLQTSVQSASLTPGLSPLNPGASTPIVAGTLPLGLLALFSACRRRVRSATARPRHLICGGSLFLAVSLLASLASVVACGGSSGGGGSAGPQTLYPTAGTYPLTVTATSGATIHTTTFTVTIQ